MKISKKLSYTSIIDFTNYYYRFYKFSSKIIKWEILEYFGILVIFIKNSRKDIDLSKIYFICQLNASTERKQKK